MSRRADTAIPFTTGIPIRSLVCSYWVEWKEQFLARIETWESEACCVKQQQIDRLRLERTALKSRLDRANSAFLEGGLDIQEFKEL